MVSEEQIQQWADEAEAGYDVKEMKRRGRGRPGRGSEPMQVVAVRLTAEELAAVDAIAERDHILEFRGDPQGAGRLGGVKIHDSALRHGVAPEDAVQAADWPLWVEPIDNENWPHRELRLGFDTQARLLETVVLIFESGDEMVIHAMPARKQYWDLLP